MAKNGIKVVQINMQHCKAAADLISRRIQVGQTHIFLIQEPYIVEGTIKFLHRGAGAVFAAEPAAKPRAAVYTSRNLSVRPLSSFCSRDMVAVKLTLKEGAGWRTMVVCSAYLPYDAAGPPPSNEVRDLVVYCKAEGLPLLVGCDANSHHTIWGSSDTNSRGDALLEFLLESELEILNKGRTPTFVTSRRQEVIDLTLCCPRLVQRIAHWHVSEEPSCSDHRYILFEIVSRPSGEAARYRNPRNTDWETYRGLLAMRLGGGTSAPKHEGTIETRLQQVQNAIITAFEDACPLRTPRRPKKVPWWNKNLEELRKTTRRLLNRASRSNRQPDWDAYKASLRAYKDNIRKSKREAWRDYCNSIEALPAASRLVKVLSGQHQKEIGALRLPSGIMIDTEEEVLGHLMDTHFPGSIPVREDSPFSRAHRVGARPMDWMTAKKVVSFDKIRWAINTFDPYKSPGPDNIFPALLREGQDILLAPLLKIFRACLALGYTPEPWRMTRVVFIRKAGRTSFERAKDYRPISLSSFLLKTLERLVDRFIRDEVLVDNPLHPNQHAYRAGRSVDTALHALVARIEGSLDHGLLALGTFMDIEGAFDNTSAESIRRALENRGVGATITGWITSMLRDRRAKSTLSLHSITVTTTRGCPQGGVLSPLLWCLVVDDLLTKLNSVGVYAQGYADDIALLVTGKFPSTVRDVSQTALQCVESWCTEVGLSVNPQKTEILPFTKKRTIGSCELVLFGRTVQPVRTVKYLGVILDAKLGWREHILRQTKRAKATLWTCRRTLGRDWGLGTRVVLWLYTSVVRPLITFASLVWWPAVRTGVNCRHLGSVQRLACIGCTGAMRTTPTAALDALLGLPPLPMVVEHEARSAAHRVGRWNARVPAGRGLGHSKVWAEIACTPTAVMGCDGGVPRYSFQKNFSVLFPSREEWMLPEPEILKPKGAVWYTDGSKRDCGSGAGVFSASPRFELSLALGKHATVLQAEIFAITTCATENLNRGYFNRHIYICSDSQAALRSLTGDKITSELVWECKSTLNRLGATNYLKLVWVPAHSDVVGNQAADTLARGGAELPFVGPEPALGVAVSTVKQAMRVWLSQQTTLHWGSQPGLWHTKLFIEGPSCSRTEELLRLSRYELRQAVSLITGHCHLNKHMHRLGIVPSPMCRLCLEEEETPYHVTARCEAVASVRLLRFGRSYLSQENVRQLSIRSILDFVKEIGLGTTD